MYNTIFIVLSNPVVGREDEYNEWYSNQHLGDLLKIPSVVGAQRFESVESAEKPLYSYLAIYEVTDIQQTINELKSRRGTPAMVTSTALNRDATTSFYVLPVTQHGVEREFNHQEGLVLHCLNAVGDVDAQFGKDILGLMSQQVGGSPSQFFEKTTLQSREIIDYRYAAIVRVPDAVQCAKDTYAKLGSERPFLAQGVAIEPRFVSFFRPITPRVIKG